MASYSRPSMLREHSVEAPLLESVKWEDDQLGPTAHRYTVRSCWDRYQHVVLIHGVLLAVNIALCLTILSWVVAQYSHGPQNAYSPARDVIGFEERRFELKSIYNADGTLNTKKPTTFNGPPRPELDEAWGNLTHHQNIRIKESELGQFADDESLIGLSDGSGYFSTLAVYHGLHCVERLHHYLYRDHYYSGLSEDDSHRLLHHTEHCLDWLRQYVQCNADTSLIPMHWAANQPGPVAKDEGTHQCVVWDRLEQWVDDRYFDAFEPGLLQHPVFGDPFGEERSGDKIGITNNAQLLHSGS